jgi:hypothetical protein
MFYSSKFEWMATDDMKVNCPKNIDINTTCLGTSYMLRISFSMFCFHILIFLVSLFRNELAA